ncbi:MAG: hypothetical protein R3E12_06785 [Candidatus Eisenbacteria bacterium]
MLSSRTSDTASGSTPREMPAGALGLAFTGVRTAVHLDGAELLRGQDLWTRACGAHLPLVVHLECRAPETHAASAGSGHEAIHAAEDGVVLVARNVQEAIDLTLLAHRISESALVPALVACDGPETHRALQDVRLPEPHVTKTFVGGPADRIPAPTPAQELLFGTARRRVPRWYDLDRPAALGGEQDAQGWALGAAGNRPFFHEAVPELCWRRRARSCGADRPAGRSDLHPRNAGRTGRRHRDGRCRRDRRSRCRPSPRNREAEGGRAGNPLSATVPRSADRRCPAAWSTRSSSVSTHSPPSTHTAGAHDPPAWTRPATAAAGHSGSRRQGQGLPERAPCRLRISGSLPLRRGRISPSCSARLPVLNVAER